MSDRAKRNSRLTGTIMIVDDEPSVRHYCRRALERAGHRVLAAEGGSRAIEMMENREDVELVLQDINMPDMDGIEVLRRVKRMRPLCEVVMITASMELENARAAIRLGAHDYLLKPFDRTDLMAAVERALEKSRLRRENLSYQAELEKKVEIKTRDLVEAERKRRGLMMDVVMSLAEAVESRDKYTEDHARRIAGYCSLITRTMGRDEEFLRDVFWAGILHDVGKIGVPDQTLYKESNLTDAEWEVMKAHAITGEKIVRKIDGMDTVATYVRSHHERYDGKGYPDGLSGNDIPLGARILAVADSFDAMTTTRPYRKDLSVEFGIEEIRGKAGTQFDPAVARAFVHALEQRGAHSMPGVAEIAERELARFTCRLEEEREVRRDVVIERPAAAGSPA